MFYGVGYRGKTPRILKSWIGDRLVVDVRSRANGQFTVETGRELFGARYLHRPQLGGLPKPEYRDIPIPMRAARIRMSRTYRDTLKKMVEFGQSDDPRVKDGIILLCACEKFSDECHRMWLLAEDIRKLGGKYAELI